MTSAAVKKLIIIIVENHNGRGEGEDIISIGEVEGMLRNRCLRVRKKMKNNLHYYLR